MKKFMLARLGPAREKRRIPTPDRSEPEPPSRRPARPDGTELRRLRAVGAGCGY